METHRVYEMVEITFNGLRFPSYRYLRDGAERVVYKSLPFTKKLRLHFTGRLLVLKGQRRDRDDDVYLCQDAYGIFFFCIRRGEQLNVAEAMA